MPRSTSNKAVNIAKDKDLLAVVDYFDNADARAEAERKKLEREEKVKRASEESEKRERARVEALEARRREEAERLEAEIRAKREEKVRSDPRSGEKHVRKLEHTAYPP